ncbi:ABC transporter substrate-binding protein [Pseudonocardia sulfidoxydans NBRC 16205]|uniref:ABC transporter substrate-binding protein n=1 Tax=Pseudonocardia sulfidoxydans NBRC 16205 TaxID=1223511 RepID=A0A511D910_9PSEU|nr:ABC transporter substrate-binding protein [Pseudonocardia sulfidoxydans]GEL21266.1 ABC transporter substrate-binding protein [Pseudonocardia sulfidoxydans NBRC 16205]
MNVLAGVRPVRALAPALLALLLVAACSAPPPPQAAPARPDCPTSSDAAADLFPDKPTATRSTNFTLTYHRSYAVLTVAQPYPGAAPESYVLLRCGAQAPELPADLADAQRIETPVRSLYAESTTQLPLLVDIGALDVLTGVGTPDFVSGPQVRAEIDAGGVRGFSDSGAIETEKVITAAPDVLLSQGTDNPAFPALRNAGVPVIGWAEYLDAGPLGKAEWIKVMGVLTGREAEAEQTFDAIARRYDALVATTAGLTPTPVALGGIYQGTWSVPTGGSATGALVRDAGGTWSEVANTGPGAVQKDFEGVYTTDGAAPVWLATGTFATMADVHAADARYGELAAVRSGRVWTPDKRIGPTGGNDFHERGVTHPEEILADLIAVLHPEALPGHEFVYYRQVPA